MIEPSRPPARRRRSRRARGSIAIAIALAAAAFVGPKPARAYERQFHFGASFGYDALFNASSPHGFGGGAHFAYGVNDFINLIAEADATWHPSGQYSVVSGAFGAAYVFDVLRWVPWVGLEVGPAALVSLDPKCGVAATEACAAFRVNAAIPFGLDYQVTRSFAVGVEGRFQLLFLNTAPWEMLGVFARAEYIWGY